MRTEFKQKKTNKLNEASNQPNFWYIWQKHIIKAATHSIKATTTDRVCTKQTYIPGTHNSKRPNTKLKEQKRDKEFHMGDSKETS